MQVVHNNFEAVSEAESVLTIQSGAYDPIQVRVPTKYVPQLEKHHWCFEASKGQVYTMDFTMELSKIFGFKTPRVYMWRYICYLVSGDPKLRLPHKDLNSYIVDGSILRKHL